MAVGAGTHHETGLEGQLLNGPLHGGPRQLFVDTSELEQDPARVADQLVMAADMLAHLFDGLDASQWERPLLYNYPTPSRHDVEWLGHHSLHEMVHHLADIDRILGSP